MRLLRDRALHSLVHKINQSFVMVDHFAEEALIWISSSSNLGRRTRLGLHTYASGPETNEANGKAQRSHPLPTGHIAGVRRPERRSQMPAAAELSTIAAITAQPEGVIGISTSIISRVA